MPAPSAPAATPAPPSACAKASPAADLSFTALVGGVLAGSVRLAVRAEGPAFLALGPLAVDPAFAGSGIGSALMRAASTGRRGRARAW